MTDLVRMILDMENLVRDMEQGSKAVELTVLETVGNDPVAVFTVTALHRRAEELVEAWQDLHRAAYGSEDPAEGGPQP